MAKKTITKKTFTSDDIELGDKVKDKITNFAGIVTGRCVYISGCDQILVQAQMNEGSTKADSHWLDVDRCEITRKGFIKVEDVSNVERPGFGEPAPMK